MGLYVYSTVATGAARCDTKSMRLNKIALCNLQKYDYCMGGWNVGRGLCALVYALLGLCTCAMVCEGHTGIYCGIRRDSGRANNNLRPTKAQQ